MDGTRAWPENVAKAGGLCPADGIILLGSVFWMPYVNDEAPREEDGLEVFPSQTFEFV